MVEESQRSIYQALKRKAEIVIDEPDACKTRKLENRQSTKPRIEFNGSDTDTDPPQSSRDYAISKQFGSATHFQPAMVSTSGAFYGNTLPRQRTPFLFDTHSDSDEDTLSRSSPHSNTSTTMGTSSSVLTSSTDESGSLTPASIVMERRFSTPASTLFNGNQQEHQSSQVASSAPPTSGSSNSETSPTISPPAASAIEIDDDEDGNNSDASDADADADADSDADDDASDDEEQDDKVEVEMEQLRYMREQQKLHIQRLHQKQAEEKTRQAAQEKASLEAMAAIGKANLMKKTDQGEQHTEVSPIKPSRPHTALILSQTWKQSNQESAGMASVSFEEAATLMRRHEPRPSKPAPLFNNSEAIRRIQLQAKMDSERRRALPAPKRPLEQPRVEARGNVEQHMKPVPDVFDTSMGATTTESASQETIPTQILRPFNSPLISKDITNTSQPQFLRLRPANTQLTKHEKKTGPLQPSAVTEHDWYLIGLFREGWKTSEIHIMMQEATGVQRCEEYHTKRYKRIQMTYPDLIPPLKELRRRLKEEEEAKLVRPVHTEQDMLAAIYGLTTTEDGTTQSSKAGLTTGENPIPPIMTRSEARPTTGGKTISPEMAHYLSAREPTPESDTDEESEVESTVRRRANKVVPKVRKEIDICYYVYEVARKTVSPDYDTDWVIVGRPFTSKEKANKEARHEKEKSRSEEGFKPMKTVEEIDKDTGMYSCTAVAKDRTVYVQVQRRLENHVEGTTIGSTDDWLPRRVFDVFERRTVTTTITERVAITIDPTLAVEEVVQDEDNDTNGDDQEREQGMGEEQEQYEATGQDKDEDLDVPPPEPSIDRLFEDWAEEEREGEGVEETDSALDHTSPVKHVRFNLPGEDLSSAADQAVDTTIAANKAPETTSTHSISNATTPTTTLREITTETTKSNTILVPTSPAASIIPLYSTPYLANDAAIRYVLSLLHSPPSDDPSLCNLLPGKTERHLDRINYIKRNEQFYQKKLDMADVTLDAQANERGGEDLDGGLISEVIEGGGVKTVHEYWPDGEDEGDDEDDDDDGMEGTAEEQMVKRAEREAREEEKEERGMKKWTFTRTIVEVWVQARTLEGPRNP